MKPLTITVTHATTDKNGTHWWNGDKSVTSFIGTLMEMQTKATDEWLSKMPYDEYLQTDHWKEFRDEQVSKNGGMCQVCKSPDSLNVHHNTYARRGKEVWQDVVVLCQPCHKLFHDNGKLCKQEG
jgi:hypothetical protein